MKEINTTQLKHISGAGFMTEHGFKNFSDILERFDPANSHMDPLTLRNAGAAGPDPEVIQAFYDHCKEHNYDPILTAKNNGWKL